jgi:Domain of unknown function (DUF4375)
MVRQKFVSIAALMDADERGELDNGKFDDELWFFLIERISTPEDARHFPKPVLLYYSSRYVEWEVGNGGFAQAAYNIPEWFDLAALGYAELGLHSFAALIREAMTLLPIENRETTFDAEEIGELFEQFSESKLALLDDRLDGTGWEADEHRLRSRCCLTGICSEP